MNVTELYRFAKWLEEYGRAAHSKYNKLHAILQHNATQPNKQPVRDSLEGLVGTLTSLPMNELTAQQFSLLKHFEIADLLGEKGADFVRRTIDTSEFDPASAASDISNAQQAIAKTLDIVGQWGNAYEKLALPSELSDPEPDRHIVRVQFQYEASIEDVPAWRASSDDWLTIARGVAMCVGEAPEDVKVVGATSGSIILELASSAAWVTLFAFIYRQLSYVVRDGLRIANAVADLKHKKMLYKEVEKAFEDERKKLEEGGLKKAISEVKKKLPRNIEQDKVLALTKAMEKFFNFYKKGGEVDFVEPSEEKVDDEEGEDEASELSDLREAIKEIRSVQSQIRLLTFDSDKPDEDDSDSDEVNHD